MTALNESLRLFRQQQVEHGHILTYGDVDMMFYESGRERPLFFRDAIKAPAHKVAIQSEPRYSEEKYILKIGIFAQIPQELSGRYVQDRVDLAHTSRLIGRDILTMNLLLDETGNLLGIKEADKMPAMYVTIYQTGMRYQIGYESDPHDPLQAIQLSEVRRTPINQGGLSDEEAMIPLSAVPSMPGLPKRVDIVKTVQLLTEGKHPDTHVPLSSDILEECPLVPYDRQQIHL